MKYNLLRMLCAALCIIPLQAAAQTCGKSTSPEQLYQEGHALFRQKAYTAAIAPLQAYLRQTNAENAPLPSASRRQEAAYMLACTSYELQDDQCMENLQAFLSQYPDTPHANRIHALLASVHFAQGDYAEAVQAFRLADLGLLPAAERDDMTFRLAVSYLKTGNLQEAAIWLETLRSTATRYEADCTYYLAYIRYTQGRYDEALAGFLSLQADETYEKLVPYYIAEIYLQRNNYDKAEIVAQNYLSAWPGEARAAEMHRIEGSARYHYGKYREAMDSFAQYLQANTGGTPRRDALYMYGMACYRCGAFSQVPGLLGEVAIGNDTLAQNAYLHMGLAHLQMGDKAQARMAFEQAAASNADPQVQEQAAYNYILCIHDTSYSAFGESVTAFEKFLNDFPGSAYADRVSSYLVDVYMSTRSYDAALASIERIKAPTPQIRKAQARILFQLGAQSFANTDFTQALTRFREARSTASALGNAARDILCNAIYWEGESLYRLGQMPQAERCFNDYLSATPDKNGKTVALAHYNLGYIAFHRKDYNAARTQFLRFLQAGREEDATLQADACNRIGDCYLQSRLFNEANQYYTRAEHLGTSSGDYSLYQLALVAGLQKDYDGKIALLDRLAACYPQSPYNVNALYEKGRSYVQSDNSTRAIATFRQLLDKYPQSPVSRKAAAEIGLLYYQAGNYDQAIDAYKQVITRYPGSEEARLAMRDLKSIYVDANRVDEFAALAAQLPGNIPFDPTEQDSLTYTAAERVYMKGETAAAKSSLNRYLQSYPDGAFRLNAHYRLCVIAKKEKNDDDLLQHASRLLEYPDSPYTEEVLLMRGEVLFNRQQYPQALADYKQLQAKATTAEHRQLGLLGALRCGTLMHDDAETIHAATALLAEGKLSPERRDEALYDRAKAYLSQKAGAKALADLEPLTKDTRTLYGAEAKYLIANQQYEAGDYAAAEKEVLDFIDQSTPHAYWLARSFVLLADIYMATGKNLDARQYLLSLQQNYQADDDIAGMIQQRLDKLGQTGNAGTTGNE